ncbi:MAG: DUF2182 domain-containing protein [Candidatus Dormibacteraeota bacterium]|nr:DUF2182 domain-containing protein [Candidatus Dormibacteraeota bacterium]
MAATDRRARPSISPLELVFTGVLLAVAAAAWAWTVDNMGGMDGGLWSYPAALGLFAGSWLAMMTAMMLPSIAPSVLAYLGAVRGRRGRRTAPVTGAAFAGGYLAVWFLAGLVPYGLLRLVEPSGSGFLMGSGGRYAAAAVLLVAAAYQLVPAKRACLEMFCVPRTSVWEVGDGGPLQALRTGLRAGGECLGCCWGLMASLVALGLMSLTWMIVVWVLIMAERLLPSPRLAVLGVAAVLAALAVSVLLGAPFATVQMHSM